MTKCMTKWGDAPVRAAVWIGLLLAVVLPRHAGAQTWTGTAQQETWVYEDDPGGNHNAQSLMIGHSASGARNVLIDFDVAALQATYPPTDYDVVSAEIHLYETMHYPGGSTQVVRAQLLTGAWSQGAVTWDTSPSVAPSCETSTNVPDSYYTWFSVGAVDPLDCWYEGAYGGTGFLLSNTTGNATDVVEAYDYELGAPDYVPYLEVTLTYNPSPVCTDNDGDGYGNPGDPSCPNGASTDCNDSNAAVNPGASEVCDGVDNDCDGSVDEEGCTESCNNGQDDDGDGLVDCNDPDCGGSPLCDDDGDGYSEGGGDCNDNDPYTYPGAPEQCDGEDNDCDGVVPWDEQDNDNDGWMNCEGDCADSEPDANPGEDEDCADGLDNDCDGLVDEDDPDCPPGDDDDDDDDDTGDDDDDDTGDDDDDDNDDTGGEFEGDQAGECADGADNDHDGDFDCEDSDCAGSPDCSDDDDDTGGCQCRQGGSPPTSPAVIAVFALLVLTRRRRTD